MSKGFDMSAPCAPLTLLGPDRALDAGAISLSVPELVIEIV